MSQNDEPKPARVLIADDHPVFLAGLRYLLAAIDHVEVVGEARTGPAAVAAARRLRPDIVLMDVDIPELNGIAAMQAILADCPSAAVLVLTILEDDETIRAATFAGARGYLLKGAGLDDIRRAVDAVRRGDAIFGSHVASRLIDFLWRPAAPAVPLPDLTHRERAVLELVADGLSNAAIARELRLSTKTVRNYLSRIFAKLQVTHRAEAAVRARREGLGRQRG
jgi:DNA-binding NarL/FixJ family response regulator